MKIKKFNELQISDYIYQVNSSTDYIIYKIDDIYEQYNDIIFKLKDFDSQDEILLTVSAVCSSFDSVTYNNKCYATYIDFDVKGLGRYVHNKTGNEYTLIQDNVKSKELVQTTDIKDVYSWKDGYVIYKAEYENPDGPYFIRTRENFYKAFTKI